MSSNPDARRARAPRRTKRRPVGYRFVLGALAVLVVGGVCFLACASGTTDTGGDGTGASGGAGGGTTSGVGGAGGGLPKGDVGGPCDVQADCARGTCTSLPDGKYCTVPCPPDCPAGTYCALYQGEAMCVPDKNQLCTKCNSTSDCKGIASSCLEAPLGDKFCAQDCTTMGDCPNGFTCADAAQYANPGGADAGAGGGSADAADEAPPHPAGQPYKFCVPSGGLSCPCNTKRDGVSHGCSVKTAAGTCTGTEKCVAADGKWEGCSAPPPSVETCNNKDDDCDGLVDNGTGNALCASHGAPPAHSEWVCSSGTCADGPCDMGWAAYPPGDPKGGCSCPVEVGEPNGDCASATGAGTISDASAVPLVIAGTLSAASDVDFWQLTTTDTNEATTNSYHVSLVFTAPAPNNEFLMDVIRGDPCSDAPAGPGTGITSYDWCVDGLSGDGLSGEAPCGGNVAGQAKCADHSSKYYVRVYRKLGATGTCTQYSISVTAKGGPACDFTQKCP